MPTIDTASGDKEQRPERGQQFSGRFLEWCRVGRQSTGTMSELQKFMLVVENDREEAFQIANVTAKSESRACRARGHWLTVLLS